MPIKCREAYVHILEYANDMFAFAYCNMYDLVSQLYSLLSMLNGVVRIHWQFIYIMLILMVHSLPDILAKMGCSYPICYQGVVWD